ncbi:MAG: lathosterol oxidase [Saprospiraceae bacterium]|jgi:lathosterol oxidase
MELEYLNRVEFIYFNVFLRYFMVAGIAFSVFYLLFRNRYKWKKIQEKYPRGKDYAREIFYSAISIGIFSIIAWAVFIGPIREYNFLFSKITAMPWWYYLITFPLLFIVHDTYFYWTHRLMHHPRLFKIFHLIHHKSTNPSPWAAYAFHPLEAVVEAGILVVISFVIPTHVIFVGTFFLLSIIYNVYGHLGFELYPAGTDKHRVGKWLNTSVNHNMHHKYFDGNYGLYFTFWDRLMHTTHAKYHETFGEVTGRRVV